MLTKTQKQTWLLALRSGEYTQGQFALYVDEPGPSFCCLGVLLHSVFYKDDSDLTAWENNWGEGPLAMYDYLRYELLSWGMINKLTQLNDGQRWTFAEIADYIEKNVEAGDDTPLFGGLDDVADDVTTIQSNGESE